MGTDHARARDSVRIGASVPLGEGGQVRTHWHIEKWDADQAAWVARRSGLAAPAATDFARLGVRPYEVSEVAGNLVTNAGWTRILNLLTAAGGQGLTNTSARIGAGNGAGTAAAGDTDLSASAGSANRWFQIMDATYPQVATNVLTLRSTFGASDGNFAWNEFGIDIGTPTVTSGNTVGAALLNHKTSIAQGTKASGQVWTATATLTFT